MADFDFSELYELAADLADAPKEVMPNLVKATEVTARHVKDDWRRDAKRLNRGRAKGYPSSIDYDMKLSDGQIGAEIGPKPGGQGSFGFLEDSPGAVRSSPQQSGRKAAKKAEKDFIKGIEKAIGDVL